MDNDRQNRVDCLLYVNQKLEKIYQTVFVHDEKCYLLANGWIVHITALADFMVVEYADNMELAQKYMFDDGNLFFFDEYDKETMAEAIVADIQHEMDNA